jgi:hypothetical protein
MELAEGGGGRGGSGELVARIAVGDMLVELERRRGVTLFAECSEFIDALRSKVGVADPERDSRPFEEEAPLKGPREAVLTPMAEGDRSTAGL